MDKDGVDEDNLKFLVVDYEVKTAHLSWDSAFAEWKRARASERDEHKDGVLIFQLTDVTHEAKSRGGLS